MNTTPLLTTLAPGLMALIFYAANRFFPPSISNGGFFSKAPEWWARDEKTWNTAFSYLTNKLGIYALVLLVICIGLTFVHWEYAPLIGFVLLFVFFMLANYQTRAYMLDKVK